MSVFHSSTKQKSSDYFLESGDKIRYFMEAGAVDDEGKLVVDKNVACNKIGHGLLAYRSLRRSVLTMVSL